ncbi:MAG: hypothetical protein ACRDS9_09305 [Pseudonocardiaceae bacterium]
MSTGAPTPSCLPGGLKPHQRQVFDFLMTHPYAAVWLGVGSGKTLTVQRAL